MRKSRGEDCRAKARYVNNRPNKNAKAQQFQLAPYAPDIYSPTVLLRNISPLLVPGDLACIRFADGQATDPEVGCRQLSTQRFIIEDESEGLSAIRVYNPTYLVEAFDKIVFPLGARDHYDVLTFIFHS
nr:hypothetical protein HmN_000850500 [Hymenolepis microstoma]